MTDKYIEICGLDSRQTLEVTICGYRLGEATDRVIAEALEVHTWRVWKLRTVLGIPPWRKWSKPASERIAARLSDVRLRSLARLKEVEPLLGMMPDNQIAISYDVSREAVRQWRKKLGIPRYVPTA